MLNFAGLASLGLLMYIISKKPLLVLSCKVGPKIPVWLSDDYVDFIDEEDQPF